MLSDSGRTGWGVLGEFKVPGSKFKAPDLNAKVAKSAKEWEILRSKLVKIGQTDPPRDLGSYGKKMMVELGRVSSS